MLVPTLFVLWSADLIEELRRVHWTSAFAYADDTATQSAGSSIDLAKRRARLAADTPARCARRCKLRITGQKAQALVLSQWSLYAKDFNIRVDGAVVEGDP